MDNVEHGDIERRPLEGLEEYADILYERAKVLRKRAKNVRERVEALAARMGVSGRCGTK